MMNPEAQRRAIAKACPDIDHTADYLRDLNAMHEAECELSHEQLLRFDRILHAESCKGDFQKAIHATAAQRAEAFLKAIGRWE